jgi:hypothetical protein
MACNLASGHGDREEPNDVFFELAAKKMGGRKTLAMLAMLLFDRT